MLIVMHHTATPTDIDGVCAAIGELGLEPRPIPGGERTAIGIVGNDGPVDPGRFHGLPGVVRCIPVSAPYKQVSREWKADSTVVTLANGVEIGGEALVMMGGPCSVESEQQIMTTAEYVARAGGVILRGGAFKPRTSPYSFQGLGEGGLRLMARARDRFGLAVITEALDPEGARLVAEYADIIQIGARNMQNYTLLRAVGRLGRPVMLKRGMAATIKEWLLAAEYVLAAGNPEVILCERGIRSFDSATRNVMDVGAIALAKSLTHLPIIGDPSHATGVRELVSPVGLAAVAAGADGLIVETHPDPARAKSDGKQALLPEQFAALMDRVRGIAATLDRPLARLRG